jgi:hypothetical protein
MPISHRRRRLGFALALAVILAAAVATYLATTSSDLKNGSPVAGPRSTGTATPAPPASTGALDPAPKAAATEQNQAVADGCELSQTANTPPPTCRYTPNTGHGDVVLVGDSHAAQWLPAMVSIATTKSWGLRVWTRANCPIADVTKIIDGAPSTSCDTWRDEVMNQLIADRPSLVIVASYPPPGGQAIVDPATGKAATGTRPRTIYEAGMSKELNRLAQAHIPTLLIYDMPRYNITAPQCALEHPTDLAACSRPEASSEQSAPDRAAAKTVPGLHTLDLTDVFCSAGVCHQIVGSIIAYRDNNHLSHEMVLSLRPRVEAAMTAAAG